MRDRRREPPKGMPPPPSPEMIDEAMEVIRERLPEYHQEMQKLRGEHPQRFELAMMTVMPVVMEYLDLRDRDQKLADTIIEEFKIECQLRELSRRYQKTGEAVQEQPALEETCQRLVRMQFDLRLQRQEARLLEFERRLEKQRQQLERERLRLEEQRTNLDELIAKRIEEIKSGKMRDRFRPRGPGRGPGGKPGQPPPCLGEQEAVGPPLDRDEDERGYPPRHNHRRPRGKGPAGADPPPHDEPGPEEQADEAP